MKKGILTVISGFAGSGKGTLTKMLIEKYDNYRLSISATTRAPRPGEVDKEHYFFKTREAFEKMIEENRLLEYAEYVGNYYGTPLDYVEKMLNEGRDVILEIEYIGAFKVKERFPEAALIFLTPPSVTEVYNRLKKRNTETEEVIRKRLIRGKEESEIIDKYDFVVVNDNIDEALLNLHNTIQCAKNAIYRNNDFINDIKKQFDEYLSK